MGKEGEEGGKGSGEGGRREVKGVGKEREGR